jgi:hypothetical protein
MGVAPVLDDDHLVQTKQNDTVDANFGAGKVSSKKRRNETPQNPKGKTEIHRLPLERNKGRFQEGK